MTAIESVKFNYGGVKADKHLEFLSHAAKDSFPPNFVDFLHNKPARDMCTEDGVAFDFSSILDLYMEGGVKMVLAYISTHIDHVDVQSNGLKVLYRLSFNADARKQIVMHGGIQMVVAILESSEDESVQFEALRFIAAHVKDDSHRKLLEKSNCSTILSEVENRSKNPHVRHMAASLVPYFSKRRHTLTPSDCCACTQSLLSKKKTNIQPMVPLKCRGFHQMHVVCLEKYLKKQRECPACMAPLSVKKLETMLKAVKANDQGSPSPMMGHTGDAKMPVVASVEEAEDKTFLTTK